MLFEVMLHCRNFFPVPGGCHSGVFTISDGCISLDFLKNGQYFLIEGSVFNDGVYKFESGIKDSEGNPIEDNKGLYIFANSGGGVLDETFTGTITALAPPKAFLSIVEEIEAWVDKNESAGSVNLSPFNSESFGGYSYSKAAGSGGSGCTSVSWKDVFGNRLKIWRCI